MRYRILSHNMASKGARQMAEALGGLLLRREGSTYRPRGDGQQDVIINWGVTTASEYAQPGVVGRFYNLPEQVAWATNKLKFFRAMKYAAPEYIPEWWDNKADIPDKAFPIVCRTVLNGHSGEGIVIAKSRDELVDAPLYVRYVRKKNEYRVHVGRTATEYKVISVQRKARRLDVPVDEVNWMVRNHQNGFVFVRNDFTPRRPVIEAAKRALAVTALDFGAVDVIWNEHTNRAYVLEVNTAPGLEGTTIEDYAWFFKTDRR